MVSIEKRIKIIWWTAINQFLTIDYSAMLFFLGGTSILNEYKRKVPQISDLWNFSFWAYLSSLLAEREGTYTLSYTVINECFKILKFWLSPNSSVRVSAKLTERHTVTKIYKIIYITNVLLDYFSESYNK